MLRFLLILILLPAMLMSEEKQYKKATFAAGCFWCVEAAFDKAPGVIETISGYLGGRTSNPSYKDISKGDTGHKEAVQVTFDDSKVSYEELLEVFWANVDPFNAKGQFCDVGSQYQSAIFYHDDLQKRQAEHSLKQISMNVFTSIEPVGVFYKAEEYHQDYYKKNPIRYRLYKNACGRDRRLKQVKEILDSSKK